MGMFGHLWMKFAVGCKILVEREFHRSALGSGCPSRIDDAGQWLGAATIPHRPRTMPAKPNTLTLDCAP
jgi:hypothetical protein